MAQLDQARSPGERIHMWRRRRGWKLSDLARAAGLPLSTLSRYERDARDMPASKLQRIAEALGVTPNDLLGYPGEADRSMSDTPDQLAPVETAAA